MANGRLYRRTQAGEAAWHRQDARVPLEYRRLVGLVEGEMHPDTLRTRLARFSQDEILEILDHLVENGLLETVDTEDHHDLDFTSSFLLGDLRKAAG
ncbi:MAG TPA: hypothetical protein VFB93_05915 [Burkholderiales bacterium]|nr:hypothetical protein [Burkholderiales bacterium]